MKPGVLVTRHVYPAAIERLQGRADVDYRDARDGVCEADLVARLAGKTAMICQLTDTVSTAVLDASPQLELVANIAVGYDNIDLAAATERGILVTNTPGVLTETTADFTWALLLAAARRVAEADPFVRRGCWQRWEVDLLCGVDVHGKTLGIVGMGRIGQAVARRAHGFGMRILYASRRSVPGARGTRAALDDLLTQADFVSLHVPLDEATHHLVGERELQRMQPHAVLINTARGPIVDESALVRALRTGTIAAAGLDVFEREPELTEGLTELANVVLAPHLGSASVETRTRMCTMAADNVVALLCGEQPPNLVDTTVWERRRRRR
ncbi:MAG: D-glycerate dehydrogenase [Planctomycetota bacterium]